MDMLVTVDEGGCRAESLREGIELACDFRRNLGGLQLPLQRLGQQDLQGGKHSIRSQVRHLSQGNPDGEVQMQADRDPVLQRLQIRRSPAPAGHVGHGAGRRQAPLPASSTMPRLTPSARPKSSAQRMTERKERMNVLKIGFAAP